MDVAYVADAPFVRKVVNLNTFAMEPLRLFLTLRVLLEPKRCVLVRLQRSRRDVSSPAPPPSLRPAPFKACRS